MITRRRVLAAGSAVLVAGALPRQVHAKQNLEAAIRDSQLIYITPLKSSGAESSCQAEVWYVSDAGSLYVVTQSAAWRAHAPRLGLTSARIWVGDMGVWGNTNGAYKTLPELETTVSYVRSADIQNGILEKFGAKYTAEWGVWGPRWRKGLADGSRVMLRYQPA